ncbi:uncharacterized protein LOC116346573 [Contarinia nasturtii]|uniref:uncharacterized protein LOC116346573 n=1 Tax=Contarinia nasturtii TaxID=265458 RepID=UPI0012D4291F|nr:uncharacterized protein LOC116346573 [Contarinia nasturtii]
MRDMSLLEQKKLQWAKEKEELSKLNDFFSATTTTRQFERTSIRTYYSNVDINSSNNSGMKSSTMPRRATYYQEPYDIPHNYQKSNIGDPRYNSCRAFTTDLYCDNDTQYQNAENLDINHGRAPILPPIGRTNRQKQMATQTRHNHFLHQNTDEETSGYLSDRMSPLLWANQNQHQQQQSQHQPHLPKDFSNYIYPSSGDELAPEMDAMKIEERRRVPKHKPLPRQMNDNGHETDFSIPKTPSSMCSDNRNYSRLSSCPPSRKEKEERAKWGDRNSHLYDTVSKESSIKSDGPCWLERGFVDSGDESVRSYSFIRGQNAPIDPNVLAERTTRRIKAIELQNAIKAQVEERERLRKIELEKTLMEERRQEEKLRQQMESNEQRYEEEQRKTREKLEREQRKQEIMRLAIEKARQEAEIERAKKKRSICSTIEFESAELSDEVHDDQDTSRTKVSQSPSPDVEKMVAENETHNSEDGEKILIGTPIRMRKKTLNKPSKIQSPATKEVSIQKEASTAPETNVDAIALVLQTLPPIMPLLSNDIISLNQNISTLNTSNIQLAVMLAQQMQQLNTIAQNKTQSQGQKSELNRTSDEAVEEKHTTARNENGTSPTNDGCKQCTGFNRKMSLNEQEKVSTEDQTQTKDAATVTDFDVIISGESTGNSVEKSKIEVSQVIDASTQTDKKMEYCFQCRYHHCHHHHVIVKDLSSHGEELKTVAVNHINSKQKYNDKECASVLVGARNMCNESKEPIKIEDRPKWGVNRPLQQYVKASERDPFYLRNKRKKHQKSRHFNEEQSRSCDDDGFKETDSTPGSRSASPSPSIITNSTVTLSSPQLKNRKRSICTEILPIKTDNFGRVYLNFNGASLQVTEDEQRPTSKRAQKTRIINRSQTANEIRTLENITIDKQKLDEALID